MRHYAQFMVEAHDSADLFAHTGGKEEPTEQVFIGVGAGFTLYGNQRDVEALLRNALNAVQMRMADHHRTYGYPLCGACDLRHSPVTSCEDHQAMLDGESATDPQGSTVDPATRMAW